jgi:hypothetical protein
VTPAAARTYEQVDLAAGRRLVVSAVLTVPVLLMAMVRPSGAGLAVACPGPTRSRRHVGAWPFHAAWTNLRHGGDDGHLISLAAGRLGWSLWALLFGGAGGSRDDDAVLARALGRRATTST